MQSEQVLSCNSSFHFGLNYVFFNLHIDRTKLIMSCCLCFRKKIRSVSENGNILQLMPSRKNAFNKAKRKRRKNKKGKKKKKKKKNLKKEMKKKEKKMSVIFERRLQEQESYGLVSDEYR